jgi:hypothetical protein
MDMTTVDAWTTDIGSLIDSVSSVLPATTPNQAVNAVPHAVGSGLTVTQMAIGAVLLIVVVLVIKKVM